MMLKLIANENGINRGKMPHLGEEVVEIKI